MGIVLFTTKASAKTLFLSFLVSVIVSCHKPGPLSDHKGKITSVLISDVGNSSSARRCLKDYWPPTFAKFFIN